SIKNDGHYFCRAGGNRPDGLNEPVTIFPLRRESLSIVQYLIKSRSNYKKIKLYDYYFRSEKKVTLKTRNYSGF
ncbi:hypothetical protein POX02_18195, partial [Escherichia coli]